MTEHYAASLTLQDIDALELPLIVLDRSGLIILANNPFLRSFALTAPQLDGLHWTDIVAAGNARRYAFSTLVSSVDQYGQAAFSCSVRTADGRVAEAQAMARALSSFAGAPVVVIIRLREERDMVSAKRRVSADTYKTLVMFSSIGILQVDECFKVRFANPAICSLLGYERPATLIGKDFSSLIAEPDRASFDAIMAKRRLGAAHTYRMRLVKANGETFKAELNGVPILRDDVFRGSFATIRRLSRDDDIAGRHPEAEDVWLDSVPGSACETDGKGAVLAANDAFRLSFGIEGQVLPESLNVCDFVPRDKRQRLERELSVALRDGERRSFLMNLLLHGTREPLCLWVAEPSGRGGGDRHIHILLFRLDEVLSPSIIIDETAFSAFNLSDREKTVAKALFFGLLYKEIASENGISLATVRSHTQNVYRKMSIHSRDELVKVLLKGSIELDKDGALAAMLRQLHLPL